MKNNADFNYSAELANMEIGNSFFVSGVEAKSLRFLYLLAKRKGITITMRKVDDDEVYQEKGVRVWRVR